MHYYSFYQQAMEKLKELLDAVNVTYSERFFESQEGVAELGDDLFVSNTVKNG